MKNEKTSKGVASEASKVLNDPHASKLDRSIAGSALTQTPDNKKKEHNKKHDYKW